MSCEDQISTQNLIDGKSDMVTIAEIATSREGGVVGGDAIETVTNRFGKTTDSMQGKLNKLGIIFDNPIRDWSASLLVNDLRAHRYPATTGDIYIPVKPLPFTTAGTFNTDDWMLFQGVLDNERVVTFDNLTLAINEGDTTRIFDGAALSLAGRNTKDDGGAAMWDVYPAATFPVGAGIFDVYNHISLPLQLKLRTRGKANAKQFGALGDGVNDDTGAIKAALNSFDVDIGGTVIVPVGVFLVTSKLVVPKSVSLIGESGFRFYKESETPTTIKGSNIDDIIELPSLGNRIANILVDGSSNCERGIVGYGTHIIDNVSVHETKLSGVVLTNTSIACVVQDLFCVNTLRDRPSITTPTGALDVDGTDHYILRSEINPFSGFTAVVSNYNAIAVYIKGATHFCDGVIGEFGEIGIRTDAAKTRFINCRADRCMGGGWLVNGSTSDFVGCLSLGNSSAADGASNGFEVNGHSNTFTSCRDVFQDGSIVNHAFLDTVSSDSQWNQYNNCNVNPDGNGYLVAYKSHDFLGAGMVFNDHFRRKSGAAVPDVSGLNKLHLNSASAETITDFAGGVNGQDLTIFGSVNITIEHNSNIKLSSGRSTTLVNSGLYHFTNYNGTWYEANNTKAVTQDTISDSNSLNNLTSTINTINKFEGRQAFNNNTNTPVWAVGSAASSAWVNGVGATAHTPV